MGEADMEFVIQNFINPKFLYLIPSNPKLLSHMLYPIFYNKMYYSIVFIIFSLL